MLNMRSVLSDDTTAAARIREAAIVRFGRQGFARTSVREIAADARVSPGLVMHHYGSKEGLRTACDEALVSRLMADKAKTQAPGMAQTMREWLDHPEQFGAYIDYFATMLADGSEGGNRLFDRMLRETTAMLERGVADGSMHPSADQEMRALMITLNGLAPLLLRDQVARALGTPLGSSAAVRRMTLPTLELYTHGLYTDSRVLDAARAALEGTLTTQTAPRSDKGPGNPNQDPDPPSPERTTPT